MNANWRDTRGGTNWGGSVTPSPTSILVNATDTIVVEFHRYFTDNTNLKLAATDYLESNRIRTDSAFCLLLKHTSNIPIAPKATLDIPVVFAPGDMNLHEALCVVSVRREDGVKWVAMSSTNPDHPQAVHGDDDNGLKDIRWLYPIHGIPESHPKANRGAVVNCQARSRIEERLQVTLTGAVAASSYTSISTRAITPKDQRRQDTDGVVVGEGEKTHPQCPAFMQYCPANVGEKTHPQRPCSLALPMWSTNMG